MGFFFFGGREVSRQGLRVRKTKEKNQLLKKPVENRKDQKPEDRNCGKTNRNDALYPALVY